MENKKEIKPKKTKTILSEKHIEKLKKGRKGFIERYNEMKQELEEIKNPELKRIKQEEKGLLENLDKEKVVKIENKNSDLFKKETKKENVEKQDKGCDHSWDRLREETKAEFYALQDNFNFICRKCGDLC